MVSRVTALLLALLLMASLSACNGGEGESGSSAVVSGGEAVGGEQTSREEESPSSQFSSRQEPEAPPRQPIGSPAVIRYPELVDEALTAAPLYQQALERPSVITYQDEIVTAPQPVYDFLAAVEKGEDWDLYLYQFRLREDDDRDCYFAHYISDQGFVRNAGGFEYNWDSMTEGNQCAADPISLNEYGYLVYGPEDQQSGTQVVNDRDLYDQAEERRNMWETYLAPIYYTGIGCGVTWSSPEELGSWLFLFEDIYNYENEDTPWDRFGSDWPVDYMVETLSRYFDGITADDLIGARKFGADAYDPQTNTIHYEGGRGGVLPPSRVTGWAGEGDTLAIDYECYEYETGVPIEGWSNRLTVRLLEDGSFRYLSNLPKG